MEHDKHKEMLKQVMTGMPKDETLAELKKYLGFDLAKIEMRPDSVGRWKKAEGKVMFDFFKEDMDECGYEY